MNSTNCITAFTEFSAELDNHYDRRERIIKISREITAASKKAIFLLHRIALDSAADSNQSITNLGSMVRKADPLFATIKRLFETLSTEISPNHYWRYARPISSGIQEYVEALSFAHYLEFGRLITHEEVRQTLDVFASKQLLPLPFVDFLLGLCDLSGELMRFAITTAGRQVNLHVVTMVCKFVRSCHADFEALVPSVRELSIKQDVTSQSLRKIEIVAYGFIVRGAEHSGHPLLAMEAEAYQERNMASWLLE